MTLKVMATNKILYNKILDKKTKKKKQEKEQLRKTIKKTLLKLKSNNRKSIFQ